MGGGEVGGWEVGGEGGREEKRKGKGRRERRKWPTKSSTWA